MTSIRGYLNLYHTDRYNDPTSLQYDCLDYYVDDNIVSYKVIYDALAHQLIAYCIRLDDQYKKPKKIVANISIHGYNYTFLYLKNESITGQQLLSWTATIELVERYEAYLMSDSTAGDHELYYNCTKNWFGNTCEYSFNEMKSIETLQTVVHEHFSMKDWAPLEHISCYTLLECNRGSSVLCLDWREICDGKIDCINNGIDEENCWQFEKFNMLSNNNNDEFLCHNGMQSISSSFYRDGLFNPHCLDRTDEQHNSKFWENCFFDPAFRCEEHACHPGRGEAKLNCGDGECVSDLRNCQNRRGIANSNEWILLRISTLCRNSMICLTSMQTSVDGRACNLYCEGECAAKVNINCPSIFRFPMNFIALNHIFFLYTRKDTNEKNDNILPTYICYDSQHCSLPLPLANLSFVEVTSACVKFDDFNFQYKYFPVFSKLISMVEDYFIRQCSLANTSLCYDNHLYKCINSSKCISTSRLVDGIQDCMSNDDETYADSCLLNDTFRFQCSEQEKKCISPLLIGDGRSDCGFDEDESKTALIDYRTQTSISFPTICDGFRELLSVKINDRYETDETDCTFWSCNTLYTRCDRIWNCPTGIDERNCSMSTTCSLINTLCVQISDYRRACSYVYCSNTNNCYSASNISKNWLCKENSVIASQFSCWIKDSLLSVPLVCDALHGYKHDSNKWPIHLAHRMFRCDNNLKDQNQTLSCYLSDMYKPRYYTYFARQVRPNNMQTTKEISFPRKPELERKMKKDISYKPQYCRRGIPILFYNGTEQRLCLCPPSYYGHLCQYQNQRVSLTLKIETAGDWKTVFNAVIMLIDDEGTIDSYDQIFYIPSLDCNLFDFNIYLLYRSRPKNLTKSYSIQIHVYDKHILEYRGSWLFPLVYSFLPVYRMSVKIIIPTNRPMRCSFDCSGHGECVKYVNLIDDDSIYYCRCNPGCSGKNCAIKHDMCSLCAHDSLCISRNVCVCPIGKEGPRCYLTSIACSSSANTCQNGGLCVPSDMRRGKNTFNCLCAEGFNDGQCMTRDFKLLISFHSDIQIPESIRIELIHHSIMEFRKAISIVKKIPFDQNSVVLYTKSWFISAFVELSMNDYYLIYKNDDTISFQNNQTTFNMVVQSSQRCRHIREVLNNAFVSLDLLQRIKYYQLPCQQQKKLACFYDEKYLCHCKNMGGIHEAECFDAGHENMSNCQGLSNGGCLNGARCFQDRHICPTMARCICAQCFYGKFCQFTTKRFGLSLDAIIGYQIQPNVSFLRQPFPVKISALLVTIMGILGLCGSYVSILTFRSKSLREVGCGWYLYMNSMISSLTIIFLMTKVWFLILSQMSTIVSRSLLIMNCRLMDYLLKVSSSTGDWLSACVAIERTVVTLKGTSFKKNTSTKLVKWVILTVCSLSFLTHIYDPFQHTLVDDTEEQRSWCIMSNDGIYQTLNTTVTLFHFILPFSINLISALITIFTIARQKASIRKEKTYKQHIFQQFRQHQHIIISPCILTALAISRLIFSFLPGCINSHRNPWLFFIAYIISFMPSLLFFLVFVLPSAIYKHECKQKVWCICRRIHSLFRK